MSTNKAPYRELALVIASADDATVAKLRAAGVRPFTKFTDFTRMPCTKCANIDCTRIEGLCRGKRRWYWPWSWRCPDAEHFHCECARCHVQWLMAPADVKME